MDRLAFEIEYLLTDLIEEPNAVWFVLVACLALVLLWKGRPHLIRLYRLERGKIKLGFTKDSAKRHRKERDAFRKRMFFYEKTIGMDVNPETTLDLHYSIHPREDWQRRADLGDRLAQHDMGIACYKGDGVIQSREIAIDWFRKSAEQSYARAQYNLGILSPNGLGASAFEALVWTRKSAEQGHVMAQYNLAVACFSGEGIEKNIKESTKWFLAVARKGHPKAQFNLGLIYINGEGIVRDVPQVVKWYQRAAKNKHTATRFAKGKSIPRDVPQAVQWYHRAAENGHATAQFALSLMYSNGYDRVIKNRKTAYMWALISSASGYRNAQERGEDLEQQLPRQQIAQGQDEAQKKYEEIQKNIKPLEQFFRGDH